MSRNLLNRFRKLIGTQPGQIITVTQVAPLKGTTSSGSVLPVENNIGLSVSIGNKILIREGEAVKKMSSLPVTTVDV